MTITAFYYGKNFFGFKTAREDEMTVYADDEMKDCLKKCFSAFNKNLFSFYFRVDVNGKSFFVEQADSDRVNGVYTITESSGLFNTSSPEKMTKQAFIKKITLECVAVPAA